MSDILIKNMEMPTKQVLAVINPDGLVEILNNNILIEEFQAIQVPPHGDLIERDKLREKEFIHDGDAYAVVMSRDIRNALTIIPASEEAK